MSLPTIGLLAMQGAYKKHGEVLFRLGVPTVEIRNPRDLNEVHGLIFPGGESTSMYKLLKLSGLLEILKEKIETGLPLLATCAGVILLAREVTNFDQPVLRAMDIAVERNAYGRQTESFETELHVKNLGEEPFPGILIRAPKIVHTGTNVEVLAELEGSPVLVKEKNILAATFHPELTRDDRIHRLFMEGIEYNLA